MNKQIFSEDEFRIIPIRVSDRFKIMKWRNEQIYHLRQKKKLTTSAQDLYFNEVIEKQFSQSKPDQILFSFFHKDVFVGYGGLVHIDWKSKKSEISFLMSTKLEKTYFETYWTHFLILIEKVGFFELSLQKLYLVVYDLRPKLYPIIESSNYYLESHLKDGYNHGNRFYDIRTYTKHQK